MTDHNDEAQLQVARDAMRASKADVAIPLLEKIIARRAGTTWSEAHVELSIHFHGQAEFRLAMQHAESVVHGPAELVKESARAIAGVMLFSARDMLELDVDEDLLSKSAEECVATGQLLYAAEAFGILGDRRLATDRNAAVLLLVRAVDLFDRAGSMLGGPTILKRLAQLAIEDGRFEDARACLERGIARLERFPFGGFAPRRLEKELVQMREKIHP